MSDYKGANSQATIGANLKETYPKKDKPKKKEKNFSKILNLLK